MYKKWLACAGLLGFIIMLDPTQTPGQPPEGFSKREFRSGGFGGPPGGGFGGPPGGGMRGSMDPEKMWSGLQRMTGSTGDTIDLNKMDPRMMQMMKMQAERSGTPLPANGILTKDEFMRNAAKATSAAGAPGGPGGPSMSLSVTPGGPMPPGGYGGGNYGRGFNGGGMGSDEQALSRIREQDKNGDGKVSFEEADSRAKSNWKNMDRNNDGFVDLEEYKAVLGGGGSRDRSMNGWDPNNGGWPQGPGGYGQPGWGQPQPENKEKEKEEEKPVAMRYGKLPKDLPSWFDDLDTDKDGQVGLYEWRRASRTMAAFTEMDLNADGLITADEYQRFNRQKTIDTKMIAFDESEGTVRPPGGFGIGAPLERGTGSSDTRGKSSSKESSKYDKSEKSGSNPWMKRKEGNSGR